MICHHAIHCCTKSYCIFFVFGNKFYGDFLRFTAHSIQFNQFYCTCDYSDHFIIAPLCCGLCFVGLNAATLLLLLLFLCFFLGGVQGYGLSTLFYQTLWLIYEFVIFSNGQFPDSTKVYVNFCITPTHTHTYVQSHKSPN